MKKIIHPLPTIYNCLLLILFACLGFAIQPAQAQDEPELVYTIVEQMPSYPGGQKAMIKFLEDNIHYPKKAQKAKIEGTVYMNFIVAKDGKLVDIEMIKGIGQLCDEEAKRVVALMPFWIPGMQNGKTVAVKYTIPIRFKL